MNTTSSQPRRQDIGTCDNCNATFGYYLIHNGFSDTAYAYSDSTCYTCLLGGWTGKVPRDVPLQIQKKITADIEDHLLPAPDGGRFRALAVPRCPHCNHPLDPIKATEYIEKNAEGTKVGWRWDRHWNGVYCIVIENKLVRDNWKV
jgi:hypothetical protein